MRKLKAFKHFLCTFWSLVVIFFVEICVIVWRWVFQISQTTCQSCRYVCVCECVCECAFYYESVIFFWDNNIPYLWKDVYPITLDTCHIEKYVLDVTFFFIYCLLTLLLPPSLQTSKRTNAFKYTSIALIWLVLLTIKQNIVFTFLHISTLESLFDGREMKMAKCTCANLFQRRIVQFI